MVNHITRVKTSNRYLLLHYIFSYVSPPLAVTMYFLLIASTPLIGHLIFRLIIRALQLASYVYLITFCVLSFRLMAVPVVNIIYERISQSGCVIWILLLSTTRSL